MPKSVAWRHPPAAGWTTSAPTSMWKKLLEPLRTQVFLARDLQENKEKIRRLRQEFDELSQLVLRLLNFGRRAKGVAVLRKLSRGQVPVRTPIQHRFREPRKFLA